MIVIGIDCSTELKKIGLALGEFSESSRHRLLGAERLNGRKSIIEKLVSWIPRDEGCLFAIDAPLGWPAPLGSALVSHRADHVLPTESQSAVSSRNGLALFKEQISPPGRLAIVDRTA